MSYLTISAIECIESTDNYGSFVAEPLEKGFGVTLGNALRRVLLGYLQGVAVTRIKIDGIYHEFSTIPHVKEDTTEFLLNIKALRLRAITGQPGKMTLDVVGSGQVCAADIKPSADFEITNPELYLVTLDSPEAKLNVEFDVELGIGYQEAGSGDNLPVGTIPVDAIFTPIRKVNYSVEATHTTGQETSRERLVLEMWTDGTISPIDALSQSADIIIKQFSPFAEHARVSQIEMEKEAFRSSIPEEQYNMPVDQMDLSVRTLNCLRRANISTVGELVAREEKDLIRLRNFGQKSLDEINDRLQTLDLSLASDDKETPPAEDATVTSTEETVAESDEAGPDVDTVSPADDETETDKTQSTE